MVFIDYSTKWVEVFAVPNQTAETIAKMFTQPISLGMIPQCVHAASSHQTACTPPIKTRNWYPCQIRAPPVPHAYKPHLPQTTETYKCLPRLANGMDMIGISISRMFCMLTGCRCTSLQRSLLSFCCLVATPRSRTHPLYGRHELDLTTGQADAWKLAQGQHRHDRR